MSILVSLLAEPQSAMLTAATPILFAAVYGFYRVQAFHPVFVPAYREWLATTPWTPAKPLPLGPVQLVGADVVLLAAAFAVTWPVSGALAALQIVKVFLATYSFALVIGFLYSDEWFAGFGLWFGLGWMLLLWPLNGPFFVAAGVMYGVGVAGLRRSLGRLTAGPLRRVPRSPLQMDPPTAAGEFPVGWPFGYLSSYDDGVSLSRLHGTMFSLLAGWTVYAVFSPFPLQDSKSPSLVFFMFSLLPAVIRLVVYRVFEYWPAVGIAARLGTGRWIIPEYDCVFVAPVTACLIALLGGSLMDLVGVPPAVGISAVVAAIVFVLLACGPERRRWQLTAPTRIVPGVGGGGRNSQWV
jgi:hypothetical protein